MRKGYLLDLKAEGKWLIRAAQYAGKSKRWKKLGISEGQPASTNAGGRRGFSARFKRAEDILCGELSEQMVWNPL
jgi:hypothetical protein